MPLGGSVNAPCRLPLIAERLHGLQRQSGLTSVTQGQKYFVEPVVICPQSLIVNRVAKSLNPTIKYFDIHIFTIYSIHSAAKTTTNDDLTKMQWTWRRNGS